MKKIEAIELYKALHKLEKLTGAKFAYAVSKNINALKPEIDALDKAKIPTEKYMAYDAERAIMAEKYAKKDNDGKPVIIDNSYAMEDQEVFDKEIKVIQKKHKDAIEEREKQVKDYNELLETPSDSVLHKIKMEDVPTEISVRQMSSIYQIVEE